MKPLDVLRVGSGKSSTIKGFGVQRNQTDLVFLKDESIRPGPLLSKTLRR